MNSTGETRCQMRKQLVCFTGHNHQFGMHTNIRDSPFMSGQCSSFASAFSGCAMYEFHFLFGLNNMDWWLCLGFPKLPTLIYTLKHNFLSVAPFEDNYLCLEMIKADKITCRLIYVLMRPPPCHSQEESNISETNWGIATMMQSGETYPKIVVRHMGRGALYLCI